MTHRNIMAAADSRNPGRRQYSARLSRIRAYFPGTFILGLALFAAPAMTFSAAALKTGNAGKSIETKTPYSGISYMPGNRRDPFLSLTLKPKPAVNEEASRGLPPPGIAGTLIDQINLEGISIREDRKTAIVRGRDDHSYFLREGSRVFDGYLKSIQEDSIILVRETRLTSGKTITQEVVKRLRMH